MRSASQEKRGKITPTVPLKRLLRSAGPGWSSVTAWLAIAFASGGPPTSQRGGPPSKRSGRLAPRPRAERGARSHLEIVAHDHTAVGQLAPQVVLDDPL